MPVNAGRIQIRLDADAKALNEEMNRAADKVAASCAQIKAAVDSLQSRFANMGKQAASASDGVDSLSKSAKGTSDAAAGLGVFETGLKRTAGAALTLAAVKVPLETFFLAAAKGAAGSTASLSTMADNLTNVYRIARLALSPTLLTAGTLALGVAVEQLGKSAYGAGGQLQAQGTIAGLNRVPISTNQVQALSTAGGADNLSSFLSLYNSSGGKDLRDIAEQLSAIKDPAEKARTALSIFGSDASTALRLLNQSFVENADRVQDWSLIYSGETQEKLQQFKSDIDGLKQPFISLTDTVKASVEGIKVALVSLFAEGYGKVRDGSLFADALAPFNLDRYADLLPRSARDGAGAAGSALSGFFSTYGAAVRGGGNNRSPDLINSQERSYTEQALLGPFTPSLIGSADSQYRTELLRNLGNDQQRNKFLADASANFPQSLIQGSQTDLSDLNGGNSVDALREKLDALKAQRSKIVSEYFKRDGSGNLQFKDSDSEVDKASSLASLRSTNASISGLQGRIDASKATAENPLSKALESIKREYADIRVVDTAVGASPGLQALAQAGQIATDKIAELNRQYAEAGKLPLTFGQTTEVFKEQAKVQLKQEQARLSEQILRANEEQTRRAQEERDKAIGFLVEEITGTDQATRAKQEQANQISKTVQELIAETNATINLADAVGKGQAAQRAAVITNIQAKALRFDTPDQVVTAQIAQAQAQFRLQDSQLSKAIAEINAGTSATGLQIAAVGKGRDADRQTQLAGIQTKGAAAGLTQDQIDAQINQAAAQFKLQDAQAGRGLSAAGGFKEFFQQMADNAQSAGNQVKTVLGGAFQGLDAQISALITGQKTSFSSFFRGIAADIAQSGLNSLFSGIAKSALSGSTGGIGSLLGALFGGGKAEGGPLDTGKWYIAGEHGPEPIWGGGSGAFAAGYGRMSGGSSVYNIDARGSEDSAATEMRLKRALNEARIAGARDGARLSRESRARVPNSMAWRA